MQNRQRQFQNHSHVVIMRNDRGMENEVYSGNFTQCKVWRFHNKSKPEYVKNELVINRFREVMSKKTTSSTIWNRRV